MWVLEVGKSWSSMACNNVLIGHYTKWTKSYNKVNKQSNKSSHHYMSCHFVHTSIAHSLAEDSLSPHQHIKPTGIKNRLNGE